MKLLDCFLGVGNVLGWFPAIVSLIKAFPVYEILELVMIELDVQDAFNFPLFFSINFYRFWRWQLAILLCFFVQRKSINVEYRMLVPEVDLACSCHCLILEQQWKVLIDVAQASDLLGELWYLWKLTLLCLLPWILVLCHYCNLWDSFICSLLKCRAASASLRTSARSLRHWSSVGMELFWPSGTVKWGWYPYMISNGL